MIMDGVVTGRVWSFRDVTGRKRAEEDLKTILRTTMDGFYLVDADGRLLDTNDAYCRMIGYSREQLLKLAIKDIEAKETDEVIKQRIQRIMHEGYCPIRTKHRRQDGNEIAIEASVTSLKDGNGKLVVFMRDITERKRAEQALRDSEKKHRVLIETTATGFVIVNANGVVLDANDEYVRLAGYETQEQILGRSDRWAAAIRPDRNPGNFRSRCQRFRAGTGID